MLIQQISNKALKSHYQSLFTSINAAHSQDTFIAFMRQVVTELSWNLDVDLKLLEKDFSDQILCKARQLGAIEALNRVLLTLSEGATYKATQHPDWSLLAGRIEIQRLRLQVPETFSEMLEADPMVWRDDDPYDYLTFCRKHTKELEDMIVPERDYSFYFFGIRTLEKSYLMKIMNGKSYFIETPQRMFLRVATFLWMPNLPKIKNYYDLLSQGYFTHASPTLFNSGLKGGSLASCFLLSIQDDLQNIFKCLGQCAMISKATGGIGLDITNIRHSKISHNGNSSGIVPMLKVYDATMRYVDQCFAPDTIVYTKRGPKEIAKITTGDKLITMNGKFGTVAKPMHYTYDPKKKMYQINIKHYYRPITVAGVHPILAIKDQRKGLNFNVIKNRLEKGIILPEFYKAEELSSSDLVAIPLPQYTKDQPIYDEDDCYMYGLMIGDGHGCKDRNEFGISLGVDSKKDIINFVKDYLQNKNIHYWTAIRNNTRSIRWSGGATFPFNRKMMYNDQSDKIIHYSMLHLPQNKCMAIFKGLIHTDGSYKDTKEIVFWNSSVPVLESLRYMLLRFGIGTSGYQKSKPGDVSFLLKSPGEMIVTQKPGYCLRIPKVDLITTCLGLPAGKYTTFFTWNNFLFTRITSKKLIEYNKNTIIELEMIDQSENGANYLTPIGLAHNGGRRKGSATIFLQPWHIDFYDFIFLKRNHGSEERRARDLFYSVWNCDIFMDRVKAGAEWTMFCPKFAPKLKDTYGEEFEKWYIHYEEEMLTKLSATDVKRYTRKMNARTLWNEILKTQIEAGMPFMTNKDTANYTSNQKNLGLIRSSNLCVSGETLVTTANGDFPIMELAGKWVDVWNGKEWSKVHVVQTGYSQNLDRVELSNGVVLDTTPYHKFYIAQNNIEKEIRAEGLRPGMTLWSWIAPNGELVSNIKVIRTAQKVRRANTYCFTEPLRNRGMFNGVLTGQCQEIIEVADEDRISSCNLASIALDEYVKVNDTGKPVYDFHHLEEVTREVVRGLNQVLDRTAYPLVERDDYGNITSDGPIKTTNLKYRPLGIGVQALADAMAKMDLAWNSQEAKELNRDIFATIYYSAVDESVEQAKIYGSYDGFEGSPASQGLLKPDMIALERARRKLRGNSKNDASQGVLAAKFLEKDLSPLYDWDALREKVKTFGLRNSLLTALMPTASSAQIRYKNESFEPFTSNVYVRSVLSGNHLIINRYMVKDLQELGLWNQSIINFIIKNEGSIQGIPEKLVSTERVERLRHVKAKALTAFEHKQKLLVDLSIDRAYYVCQSQSLNIHIRNPTFQQLTSLHFYAWENALTTGMYYLRSAPSTEAIKFTVEGELDVKKSAVCTDEVCVMCQS